MTEKTPASHALITEDLHVPLAEAEATLVQYKLWILSAQHLNILNTLLKDFTTPQLKQSPEYVELENARVETSGELSEILVADIYNQQNPHYSRARKSILSQLESIL